MLCMYRTIKIFISNCLRTRKFSQLLQAGKTGAFGFSHPRSRVGHALRSISMLWLVKIWQVSSFAKFMQHLESCLLWQLKLTEFCVNLWSVRNIPKFKDRANWSRDTFQPSRRRACVYHKANQNIAPVIKNFQNSGRSRNYRWAYSTRLGFTFIISKKTFHVRE